jgi:hypothetical protein
MPSKLLAAEQANLAGEDWAQIRRTPHPLAQ